MSTLAPTWPATPRKSLLARLAAGPALPIGTVLLTLLIVWYAAAVRLNAPQLIDRYQREQVVWSWSKLTLDAWAMERPVLPAPHQILVELDKTVLQTAVTSRRSLVYHAWVTLSSAALGFVLGAALGVALAIGIVHVRTLDRSLMPWIVASQTIPILAIAPMIIVVLAAIGITGLLPKALISTYLCFFPVAIGMVKGLRSPEPLQLDLMRTWSASPSQMLWQLRWPASLPFLFAGLKVAVAISVVGAIVGELPTGAQAGLGARLLTGSYYGQTVQIWAALVMASVLAAGLVGLVGLAQRITRRRMGAEP
jgi:NitT/TauT family transport system permease protein